MTHDDLRSFVDTLDSVSKSSVRPLRWPHAHPSSSAPLTALPVTSGRPGRLKLPHNSSEGSQRIRIRRPGRALTRTLA